MNEFVANKNENLRRLCKMIRAWKNKHGIAMGGLLIDTLVHKFLNKCTYYDSLSRVFFKFLMEEDDHEYYFASESRQKVKVKKKFQGAAKRAYDLSVETIRAGESAISYDKWKNYMDVRFLQDQQKWQTP
ncbi:hypothetical protein [Snodgrassella alvi]|uniref:hypothetical protein n=1 Tax=Snodgrassella alvi TaxID=1196083 RepID=UPI002148712C|nr:hypothetical protein [Snodgrassella alvi]